jgi:hypothetical protein
MFTGVKHYAGSLGRHCYRFLYSADLEADLRKREAVPRVNLEARHREGFKACFLDTNRVDGRGHSNKVEETFTIAGGIPGCLTGLVDEGYFGAWNKSIGDIPNRTGYRCRVLCSGDRHQQEHGHRPERPAPKRLQ